MEKYKPHISQSVLGEVDGFVTSLIDNDMIQGRRFNQFVSKIAKRFGQQSHTIIGDEIDKVYYTFKVKDPNAGQVILSFLDYDRIRFDTGQGKIELKYQDDNNDIMVSIQTLGQYGKPFVCINSTHELSREDMNKYAYTDFFKDCTFTRNPGANNLRADAYGRREFYKPVGKVCRYVWDIIKEQYLPPVNRSGY